MKTYLPYALVILLSVSLTAGGMILWQNTQQNTQLDAVQEVVQEAPDASEAPVQEANASEVKITKTSSAVLSYDLGDLPVQVSQKTTTFDYDAKKLYAMASECGQTQDFSYFEALTKQFKYTQGSLYTFKYTEPSQSPNEFFVRILPNVPGYKNIEDFENDFNICAAGGDAYPSMMTKDWLLFVSSCGSGFDDESGRTLGCQEIRDTIEKDWKLN